MNNRTPRKKDIDRGIKYFLELVEIFDIQHIGCIGRKSFNALMEFDNDLVYLRHPSCGGKIEFENMIEILMENYLWKRMNMKN